MRVLLASPYMLKDDPQERRGMRPFPPLGPLYIAAALEAAGHEVRFYDATFERDLSGFGKMLDSWGPEMAGVYSTFLSKAGALRLGEAARQRGIFALAGGPEATVYPEQYLLGHFDAVVMGEGESTAVELASGLGEGAPLDGIAGLALMSDGKLRFTGPRPLAPRLDALPFPLRKLVDIESYRKAWTARHGFFAMNLMASRGCPFGCRFCSRPVFGRSHRRRSVGNVMAEMRHLVEEYRPQRIRFSDDILPQNRQWTLELCGAIQSSESDVGFECLARMDLMDRELLAQMGRAGFRKVYYGVESGSQRILDAMGKGTNVEDIRRVARLTREAGMEQHWFIMLGYPGERQEDVEKTLALMAECRPEEFSTTLANPMKGTPLYSEALDAHHPSSGMRRPGYALNVLRMHAQSRLARSRAVPSPLSTAASRLLRSLSFALAGGLP